MVLLKIHLACLFLGAFLVTTVLGSKEVSDIIDSLFPEKEKNPTDYYDKRLRPNYGKSPVKVTVSAYVLDVFDIDEKKHEFTAQLYLRQIWNDPRLAYKPPAGVKHITLDAEHAAKLWVPDTFCVNERSSIKHENTVANIYTRVSSDGDINRSIRTTITASCPMHLKWFPFDRHICSLGFESYGYSAEEFYYVWKTTFKQETNKEEPAIGVSQGAGGSTNQQVLGINGQIASVNLTTGSYSRFSIDVLISRVSTRFIQDVYFPAFVLVSIAFITMTVGALQFRVLLSVICMVGIIIFTSLLSMEMPKVSYQTALDFYVFKCSFMIFNVVIVNFIMYHLLKPSVMLNTRMRMRQINGGGGNAEDAKEILPEHEPSEDFNIGRPTFDSRFKELVYKCCMYSKFTMPTFFLVFNIIYWPVVLLASNSVGEDLNFMLLENTN